MLVFQFSSLQFLFWPGGGGIVLITVVRGTLFSKPVSVLFAWLFGDRIFQCSSGLTLNSWSLCFIFSIKPAVVHYQILPLFWFIMKLFCLFKKKLLSFFQNHFCHSLSNFSRIIFSLQIIWKTVSSKRMPKNINLKFFILCIPVLWFWLLFYFENRMHTLFILQVLSIESPNSRC